MKNNTITDDFIEYERLKSKYREELKGAYNKAEGEGKDLIVEDSDLMKYFRLAHLRDMGELNEEGLVEFNAIVHRNIKAFEIEAALEDALNKPFDLDRYEAVKKSNLIKLEGAIAEAKKDGKDLSPEDLDLMKYLKLSLLRENGQLDEDGLKEIDEIVHRNLDALEIEVLERRRNKQINASTNKRGHFR